MNFRFWALALALTGFLGVSSAQQTSQQGDFIVAVVNSEPITKNEVQRQMQRVVERMQEQGQKPPAPEELRRAVLERLINDRAQVQLAQELGLRVDDLALDQAEESLARQSQIDVAELRKRTVNSGLGVAEFRTELREQLLINRLHEREVGSRIRITDQDVDRFIQQEQASNSDPLAQEINLAHLLVAVPEKATSEEAAALFLQARTLLARIRAGENFEQLVRELSAAQRTDGGQLGLRRADRYPTLFVAATQNLAVGEISDVVRSGAGFHILKVVERRAPNTLVKTEVQSRARHILLRVGPQLTQDRALARMAGYRQRIVTEKATFQSLAREFSEDGSAAQGGDLGWVNPGAFVPEFEAVLNRLEEGEISQPMVSRFGVHLIQLMERRRIDLSPQEVRAMVRSQLREARYEEAYAVWARDLRERAFVEMREPQ
jgi:peptidyl-prolyl cis-trans isomerase SurA